ncbi:hypothetical protein C8R45DRAFT_942422 [Mycena sanguinolenta]|nr:hypothetical protein C8R45DRAFT_942422 [Mycena sanguinolenta]
MFFLRARLRRKGGTNGSSQTNSTVNKLNLVNKATKLAGGVGEVVPVAGSVLKGISEITSVILESIEVSRDHMFRLPLAKSSTVLLSKQRRSAGHRAEIENLKLTSSRLLAEMERKIAADLAHNTRGLTPYLHAKGIKNVIDGFKVELDDIRIHWLMKTMSIVATVSPDDGETPYYKLRPADVRLEPDTVAIPSFSVATVVCNSGHVCRAEKVLMRRYDSEEIGPHAGHSGRNSAAMKQAFEYDLAALEKMKNLRFPQIFGICRTSSLNAIVFNEGMDAFMKKEQYQRRHNLKGIPWILHQLAVDTAVDMVKNHGIVIETQRYGGSIKRPSWLHDPLLRAFRQSFESRSLVSIQWGIPNVFEWTLDPNANSHSLTIYIDWTVLRMPYKTEYSVLYCAYIPYFNVEWREPKGFSITISRKHALAPEKLNLYVQPPELDLRKGNLVWQPLRQMLDDGTLVNLPERDFTFQYQAIYTCCGCDPRGFQALVDLHDGYGVDQNAQGRDIARKIGPEVQIMAFLATEVTWLDFLHSNCGEPEGNLVGDDAFFRGLQDLPDVVIQPNPLPPQIEEVE